MAKTKNQPIGRPIKYKPEYVEKVGAYIQQSLNTGQAEELPTQEGLSIYHRYILLFFDRMPKKLELFALLTYSVLD